MLVDDVDRGVDVKRVAVGLAFRHHVSAERGRGPGAVVEHHRLAEIFAELGADHARDAVDRPARRRRNDDADRLRRVFLGLRERREAEEYEKEEVFQAAMASLGWIL